MYPCAYSHTSRQFSVRLSIVSDQSPRRDIASSKKCASNSCARKCQGAQHKLNNNNI